MQRIRIGGVVKARRQVEALLAKGGEAARRDAVRVARSAVDQVEGICAERGGSPVDLPAPSRKAHAFLAEVAKGAGAREAAAAALEGAGSSRRVGRTAEKAAELGRILWRRHGEVLRDRELFVQLERRVQRLLGEVRERVGDGPVAELGGSTGAYARWLSFLLEGDHLRRTLKVLDRAARAMRDALPAEASGAEIILVPDSDEYLKIVEGPPLAWWVSGVFFNAPKRVWKALVAHARDADDADARAAVEAYLESESCDQVERKLQPRPREVPPSQRKSKARRASEEDLASLVARLAKRRLRPKETWHGGIQRTPFWVTDDDPPWRLHLVVWIEMSSGRIHDGASARAELLTAQDVLEAMVEAAEPRGAFGGYRPGTAVVNDIEIAKVLQPLLAEIGTSVVYQEKPDGLDLALESMIDHQEHERGLRIPGPLEPKGMTAERIGRFADAARSFYEAKPWLALAEEDVIEVEPHGLDGLRFAHVLGNGGAREGLVFVESAVLADEDEDDWRQMLVAFDPKHEMPARDLKLFEAEGFEVAADDAYPSVLRFEGARRIRRPGPRHLAFVEGVLRALADLDEDEIDGGRWSREVETADGPLTLTFTIEALLGEPPDSAPAGVPDRMALEGPQRALARLLAEGDFDSIDDVNEILSHHGGDVAALAPAETPADRARDIVDDALRARGRWRVKLARQALALDPDCAEAHLALADFVTDAEAALPHLERAVEAARRSLDPRHFEEHVGHFWGLLETRPYMRARARQASCYERLELDEAATAVYENLMELDPDDHQGVRYSLVGCLLRIGREDEARRLIARYVEDDVSAIWRWAEALLAFREHGDTAVSRKVLGRALDANEHVADMLLGRPVPEPDQRWGWTPGDVSEAPLIVGALGAVWSRTPKAMDWLAARI